VATNPEYDAIKARLRRQLVTELENKKDPRLNDNAFDRPPFVGDRRR